MDKAKSQANGKLAQLFPFPAKDQSNIPEKNFTLLIETAQKMFPYNQSLWESDIWDITEQNGKVAKFKGKRFRLTFSLTHSRSGKRKSATPFSRRFSDLLKAFLTVSFIENRVGYGPQHTMLTAARYLYPVLLAKNGDILTLNQADFQQAASELRAREAASTCYRIGKSLELISKMMDRFRLTSVPIEFKSPFKRTATSDPLSERSIDRASKLQLKEEVLEGIVQLNSIIPLKHPDRLIIEILKLFLFTGMRASEVLTLGSDCLVCKEEDGEEFVCLKYYPAKGGHKTTRTRWFGDLSGKLIKQCVTRILEITEEPRKVASWLLENEGKTFIRTMIPGPEGRKLCLSELQGVFGTCESGLSKYLHAREIKPPRTISSFDEAFCLNFEDRYTFVDMKTGYKLLLDKTLLINFKDQYNYHVTKKYLVEPITDGQLQVYFNGKPGKYPTPSLFERYNLRNRQGKPLRVSSHMFRRFLNTMYNEGGVPITMLTKIFGRANKKDTLAYLYTTPKKRTEEAREMFRKGDIIGPKADIAKSIPISKRDSFIDTVVESVHHLGHGFCSHDWSTLPCEKHLQCAANCVDFHVRKDDPNGRKYLLQQKKMALEALSSAKVEDADRTVGARNHVKHYETILKSVESLLSRMESN